MSSSNPIIPQISSLESEPPAPDRYERLPGLYRRWEIDHVVEPGVDFRFDPAGQMDDGTPLFAAYRARRTIARLPNQQRKGH